MHYCQIGLSIKKVLLVDNFDSFTYNIAHALASLGVNLTVLRNNTPLTEIEAGAFDAFVIGPGPGKPSDAGVSRALFSVYHAKTPILGICLGLQAMNDFFGGRTVRAKKPMHGKLSALTHDEQGLFQGIPQGFSVMRYHSLVIERKAIPSCLAITAETAEGEVMGLRHRYYPLEAVQFHPESHASEYGQRLFLNWLQLIPFIKNNLYTQRTSKVGISTCAKALANRRS